MARLLILGDARSVHIERWGRYFAEEGFEVALFSLEPKTIVWPRRFYASRHRTPVSALNYLMARKDLSKAIEDFRPDLINAHYVVSYGWMASYYTLLPTVLTAWGSDLLVLPQKSIIHRRRVSRALKRAAFCTVDNQNLHRAAQKYMPAEKIIRILMGIDRDFFESAQEVQLPTEGPIRLIAPRGLQKVYDPSTIIDAAAMLRGRIDFKIDMLGEGPEVEAVGNEIRGRSLTDLITLQPFLPHEEFALSLKNYHIYLSASLSDSTSVALLEAMTVGLFPIVSDIEGNREWIEDGINGVTFEPGSASSLAEAMIRAEKMRSRFGRVAEINRARIERDAIWQDNMQRVKNIFQELIHE